MNGKIGVTTENIFPVIKKFLYSEQEIFIREIVSNACDATQKLKTAVNTENLSIPTEDLKILVKLDKDAGTITVSDMGIGMSEEELDKYINQIAFSGAAEFLEKYKDSTTAIIGHFGLGFYSSFMISDKVEIFTKSYKDGVPAVHWTCNADQDFTMEECDKTEIGTDIVMHISDEFKEEYINDEKIVSLLAKYSMFLPVPIYMKGVTREEEDPSTGEKTLVEATETQINTIEPLWIKKPSELTNEDYLKFYHDMYPGKEDPLFWIHLNIDFPYTLTGILYFPVIKSTMEITRDNINLYCNQVFVTEHVTGILPDFLCTLHGIIDSPDIPLNVSRSYLQSDSKVRQISQYIIKKVTQAINDKCKNEYDAYKDMWSNIKIFIDLGILTQQDLYDKIKESYLVKDVDDNYWTIPAYKEYVKEMNTDENDQLWFLYTNNVETQYTYIQAAKDKGYNVLLFNSQLDTLAITHIESKESVRMARIDAGIIENIIRKKKEDGEDKPDNTESNALLVDLFTSQLPQLPNTTFSCECNSLGPDTLPTTLTIEEFIRRMKDAAKINSAMQMWGNISDAYVIHINTDNELIADIEAKAVEAIGGKLGECKAASETAKKSLDEFEESIKDQNKEELTDDEKKQQEDKRVELNNSIKTANDERTNIIKEYASGIDLIKVLIDTALLSNGLLKGEKLTEFIKKSISLYK